MSLMDVAGAAQEAARKAAQEAARKAAEEAARKAAQEAARKAAEQGAKAAHAGAAPIADAVGVKKAITTRLSAYDADAPAPAAGPAPAPPDEASAVPARFGFGGVGKVAGEAISQLKDVVENAVEGAAAGAAAGAVENVAQGADPVLEAQQEEVAQASNQATISPEDEKRAMREAREAADAKAANAEVPLDPQDERVTKDFNEQELQAYKELPVDDRKKFNDVYQYLHCENQSGKETQASISARDGFRKALTEGTLVDKDKEGTRVLDHFGARMRTDLADELKGKGVDARGQLQTLAYQIAHPGTIFQGEQTDTCVAASLQTNMAARNPGEYMRVATGLLFDGKVTLHGPKGDQEIKLDTSALYSEAGEAYSVRATTNQLLQQSFMSFAREKYPAQEGDILFTGGRYGRGGQYGGDGEGLTLNQAEQLFENVSGSYVTPVGVTDENRAQSTRSLEDAVASGQRVQVGLASDRGGHMVAVLGIETDAEGRQVVRYSDSNEAAEKTMPLDKFMELSTGMVLPSQYAGVFVSAGGTGASGDYGGGRGGGVGG